MHHLEEKIAHLEYLLLSLNDTVARQDRELADLRRLLALLYERPTESADFAPAHEIPPHY